jgi:lipopolysaccharide transport system permease protein
LLRVTRQELASRYAGSIFGLGWVALTPLIILGLYSVIYLIIFRVRVPSLSPIEYVLYIFSGLVPYLMTAESLSSGVGSLVLNKSLLNNTVFPIDLAPPKAVLMSQGTMVVGLTVIIVGAIAIGILSWTALLLPVVWALHVLALMGLTWMLSLLNVVIRDLQIFISSILIILLIASPIAYTPEMVPPALRPLLTFNPFAYFVITYQKISILGQLPSVSQSLILVSISLGLFILGSWFFARVKQLMIDYV